MFVCSTVHHYSYLESVSKDILFIFRRKGQIAAGAVLRNSSVNTHDPFIVNIPFQKCRLLFIYVYIIIRPIAQALLILASVFHASSAYASVPNLDDVPKSQPIHLQ